MIAGLIDPEAMRLEIGGRRHLRQRQLFLAAQRGDDLGGQEMRIDNQIPRLFRHQLDELAQVQFLNGQSQPICAVLAGTARLIHQIVEVTQNVRCLVDEIEIKLAVETSKRRVGQFENIDVTHRRIRDDFTQG